MKERRGGQQRADAFHIAETFGLSAQQGPVRVQRETLHGELEIFGQALRQFGQHGQRGRPAGSEERRGGRPTGPERCLHFHIGIVHHLNGREG